MANSAKPAVRYRIKSFCYDSGAPDQRFLFTVEEVGVGGEVRQFAAEITKEAGWKEGYSQPDASVIEFVAEMEASKVG